MRRSGARAVALAALVFLSGCATRGPMEPLPGLLVVAETELTQGNIERAAALYGRFLETRADAPAATRARAVWNVLVRLLAVEAEAERLRSAYQSTERALADREEELQRLVAELSEREAQDQGIRARLDAVRTSLDTVQTELDGVRAERERLQAETERLRADRERLRADVERLRSIDLREPRR